MTFLFKGPSFFQVNETIASLGGGGGSASASFGRRFKKLIFFRDRRFVSNGKKYRLMMNEQTRGE